MFKDKKKLEVIKNLRKELVILKPDKGNRIALIGTNDYYTTVENLFSDKSKFKELHDDPTPARLSSHNNLTTARLSSHDNPTPARLSSHDDPTPARLSSIQRHLKKLNNRNELNDEVFKKIRPQNAKLARAHGVPKVHKTSNSVPPFRPIIDITGTIHYSVGKYLSELLNPLTQSMYTVKDSFDAANKINQILRNVQNSGE